MRAIMRHLNTKEEIKMKDIKVLKVARKTYSVMLAFLLLSL